MCGKHYRNSMSLKRHLNYVCGREPQYGCDYCSYRTKHRGDLKKHTNEVHDPNPTLFPCLFEIGRYRCSGCGKSYNNKVSLNRHAKFVCGIEPQFSCHFCSYKTKHKGDLKKHTNDLHEPNPRLFFCSLCPYAAKRKQHLIRHYTLLHRETFSEAI
ncbi:hypothetical protein AAG570_013974 [Ranatra chinensis]|uniref:C2H2-type domain-containing protein n=1 Tax=Ranatra chinensis TaxID=642074 RepID=A0ABD0YW80_9HEMI